MEAAVGGPSSGPPPATPRAQGFGPAAATPGPAQHFAQPSQSQPQRRWPDGAASRRRRRTSTRARRAPSRQAGASSAGGSAPPSRGRPAGDRRVPVALGALPGVGGPHGYGSGQASGGFQDSGGYHCYPTGGLQRYPGRGPQARTVGQASGGFVTADPTRAGESFSASASAQQQLRDLLGYLHVAGRGVGLQAPPGKAPEGAPTSAGADAPPTTAPPPSFRDLPLRHASAGPLGAGPGAPMTGNADWQPTPSEFSAAWPHAGPWARRPRWPHASSGPHWGRCGGPDACARSAGRVAAAALAPLLVGRMGAEGLVAEAVAAAPSAGAVLSMSASAIAMAAFGGRCVAIGM